MNRTEQLRYYGGRILDRLEQRGLPLRARSLLFYERAVRPERHPAPDSADGRMIGPVSEEQFRAFRWTANPNVVREALARRGTGRRWVIAARRGEQMDGFCWLEADAVDMFFFDLDYRLPVGTYYFSRMWVCPDLRRQGIARALMLARESFAADMGATNFLVACVPHNFAMRRLLTQLGWSLQQRIDYRRVGPVVWFGLRPASGRGAHVWSHSAAARLLEASAAGAGRFKSVQASAAAQADTTE